MNDTRRQIICITYLTLSILCCSFIAIGFNHWRYHFTGNNYFPPDSLKMGITLLLLYLGSCIHFGVKSKSSIILIHILAYYGLLAMLALITNAAQYTPFQLIDSQIANAEFRILHIHLTDIVAWTHQHIFLGKILAQIYNSLSLEMVIVPLFLIATLQHSYFYEYMILMLLTALLGFGFYYFFPSNGPASLFESHYFTASQIATGIKFADVHHHIQPSTLEGGLIALPSYHTIWAWLSTYAMRNIRPLYRVLLGYNGTIIAACILLGWHYFTDLLGSLVVLLLAHGFCVMHRTTAKRRESSTKHHTRINQISISNNTII